MPIENYLLATKWPNCNKALSHENSVEVFSSSFEDAAVLYALGHAVAKINKIVLYYIVSEQKKMSTCELGIRLLYVFEFWILRGSVCSQN